MQTTKQKPNATQNSKASAKLQAKANPTKEVKPSKSEETLSNFLNPTAEDRILRAKNFGILAKKHEFLKNKADELTRFIISSDGTKEKIVLKNAEGVELEVSNTQVIEKVVDVITGQLNLFLMKSQEEILQFSI